ncbi:fatty acyl-AMP ligase [Tamlana flava]|uniref:fatty acyl-AMP ligase n=1 Tax=Tamlana flava TaxID=3158572 RepID=UPI00351AFEA7
MTLVDVVLMRAKYQPDKLVYRFLKDGESHEHTMTFRQLDQRSKSIASELQRRTSPGERVLLLVPAGLDFISSFFGTLYAGNISIPVPPPHFARIERTLNATLRVIKDANPSVVIVDSKLHSIIKHNPEIVRKFEGIHFVIVGDDIDDSSNLWERPNVSGEDLALLQYTSGSTYTPKGVMLSHNNLLSNLEAIERSMDLTEKNESVFWLPPFHDMGLIGGILQPLYSGFTVTLIPHLLFLQRPIRWLQAISKYKALTTGAPNSAYELCLKKVKPEQRDELDLSSLEIAINGAEPINVSTLNRFKKYFSSAGFRETAFIPCYGLAEATLMVAADSKLSSSGTARIGRRGLERNEVEFSSINEKDLQTLVSCGRCIDKHEIKIVNPESCQNCSENEIGEIWLKGPSVAKGYWNNVTESEYAFKGYINGTDEGPFLRTGDLGFKADGELYVTGRMKSLIIIDGKNFYPHDIERVVQNSHFAVQPLGCAAFSIEDEGREQIIILAEIRRNSNFNMNDLTTAIRNSISGEFGLSVADIRTVPLGFIPRTTSGKIKYHECKKKYLTN